jgi:Cu(I)/Ag(I) efflux system membrane protein CusA/SilA
VIESIIRLCARNAVMVVLTTIALALLTIASLTKLPLDALPDLTDTQVIVFSEWPGRAADIVETQLTYPLTTKLLSTQKVKYIRGVSMTGGSQIVVVFDEGTDLYWARARILEKLAGTTDLPAGVTPQLGPEATGLGWVFQYALVDKSGNHSLADLRSLQDWNLKFELQSLPGVAEVAAVGGFVKQYQIDLDPIRLQAAGISPLQVVRALRNGNQEVGAGVLEMGGSEFAIRGRGYLKSRADIEQIPLSVEGGRRLITIGDLGSVQIGPAPRQGVAELDGDGETVGGIVVMRMGENALNVINRVKEKLESVKRSLPKGVEVVPVYDRSSLITRAIGTLGRAVSEEVLIVAAIVSIFLWHARASFVAILPLPIAVLLSFLPMLFSGLTVNIMSLGGIALAIGAMVDSGIILIENAHKRLEGVNTATLSNDEREKRITDALVEMGRPLFFSLLVITVSFLPVFTLEDREGRLFRPLAFTKTVSMAWAAVMAITLIPALSVLLLKGKFVHEDGHPVSHFLHRYYEPVVDWVVLHKKRTIAFAAVAILATIPVAGRIQSEFMPPLNEGSILYMPTATSGMSIDTAAELLQKQDAIIKKMPEVEHVFGKAGRAGSPTDPAPLNMFETVITLKPESEWRPGISYDKIVSELNQTLDLPGMPNIWWMPIQTRVEMISTGVRTAVGIKVLGSRLEEIESTAIALEEALKKEPGVRSVFAERTFGGQYLDIEIDRRAAALFGLNIADIHAVIETAMAGLPATTIIEGRERYTARVRYLSDFRSNLEDIENIIVPIAGERNIKLSQVARLQVVTGPAMIQSESGKLLGFVFIDLKPDVGLSDFVARAKKLIDAKVTLPTGVTLRWSGQFEALERARKTLAVVAPITLLLIVLLLYLNTHSLAETGIVLAAVPFSLIGAFWLMWMLDYKLSVASWVGILALAGLDAETGVVMLLYLTESWKRRLTTGLAPTAELLKEAIHEGAVKRIRPKLMTVTAALVGLLPVMWATGTGSEVMKRIAAPMVGGIVTSGVLELLVYPAIFALWKGREIAAASTPVPSP